MPTPDAPILFLNPPTDSQFVQRVSDAMERLSTSAELQRALRAYYPGAVVRSRDLDGDPAAWYVYRDGRWIPPPQEG
jgi:hypothetical protein